MSEIRLIHSTFSSPRNATEIAEALVERNLAACVNIGRSMESHFVWDGESQTETEIPFLAKSTRARLDDTLEFLRREHPYDCPELLVTEVDHASEAYEDWVLQQVNPE